MSDLKFTWTFGDGSPAVTGDVEPGVTTAAAAHAYADHRPVSYTATLTVKGKTDAGDVEASDSVTVRVAEKEGYVIGGWSVGDTGKDAVRALCPRWAPAWSSWRSGWPYSVRSGSSPWRSACSSGGAGVGRATAPGSRRNHSPRTSAGRERRTDA